MILFKIAGTAAVTFVLSLIFLIVEIVGCKASDEEPTENKMCKLFGAFVLVSFPIALTSLSAGLVMMIWG